MQVLLLQQQSKFIQHLQALLDHTQLHGAIYQPIQILEQLILKVIIMGQRQVEQARVL